MAAFHYVVKAKLIRHIKGSGEIEFLEFEDKFENESPIIARNEAFQHYQNYIDVLLEAKHKKYYSDKQARDELESFIDPGTKNSMFIGGKELVFSDAIGNGIGIFLIIDTPIADSSYDDKEGDEIFIHGIGSISYYNNTNSLVWVLERELDYYKQNNYETQNQEIDIVFCDSDEWMEGYLGDGQWRDSYNEPNQHKVLKTPFDWTGYDKPYWWGKPDIEEIEDVQRAPKTLEEMIEDGESNQVEFKPSLLYNFKTGKGGIGVKGIIAKAICAFLNSNGGILIIGITDKGETQGLSYDFSLSGEKNNKDFFMLEFDQMLEHFLSFSIKNNVSGKFYRKDDKDIFVVTVSPSKRRPIFLASQNEKEFYVRGEASSRKLTDIEELVNYCIEKWGV